MTGEATIRPANADDAEALGTLLRSIGWFEWMRPASDAEAAAAVRRQLERCLDDESHSTLVAEIDRSIVGYAAVHWLPYLTLAAAEGFVSELFVREQHRGRGVGTQLLDTVEAEARRRGCIRLQLINMRGRESYTRGYYAKAGWQERPEAANFVLRLDR